MTTFNNIMLLYEKDEIYGNESTLLQKLGRLLVASNKTQGVTCYVLNTTNIPVSIYHVQRLTEECLTKRKTFKEAFGIHDGPLADEAEVLFQKAMDGSFSIRFKTEPIKIDRGGGEFYTALVQELTEDEIGFRVFPSLIQAQNMSPKVRVLLHNDGGAVPGNYDVTINLDKAGFLARCIPYFWDVYYNINTPGIEYNPVLMSLPKESLHPVNAPIK